MVELLSLEYDLLLPYVSSTYHVFHKHESWEDGKNQKNKSYISEQYKVVLDIHCIRTQNVAYAIQGQVNFHTTQY